MTLAVSVLLPFRNAEATLGEALDSVVADVDSDAHAGTEVLAIDDGSTDGSRTVAVRFASAHPCVRVLNAGGVGIAQALAFGAREARGAFIARMDADDISLPGRFAAQRALLEASDGIAVAAAQVELFPEHHVEGGMRRYVDWQNALVTEAEHRHAIFVESPVCHPSVMMRRSALDAVGGYRDCAWAEDYDLWLRLHAAGYGIAKVPRVLLRWRQGPGRLTFTDARYSEDAFREARAHYLAPRLLREPRSIVVWGAGATGKRLARALEAHGARPRMFIDIDPRKIGGTARGVPVSSAEVLDAKRHFVVAAVGSWGARDLIAAHLKARGFLEQQDFLLAS